MYCKQLNNETDNFDFLPRECAARNPSDNKPILIRRGHSGYYPLHPATDVDLFNKERNITHLQIEAMTIGSIFGWDVPGADPRNP